MAGVMTISVISTPVVAGPGAGTDQLAAIETVKSYLNALVSGDTSLIRSYLAPQVIKERQALLDNPDYPQTLQNAYRNASIEVLGAGTADSGDVWVDVKIILTGSDAIHSRFVVAKYDQGYLIVDEK